MSFIKKALSKYFLNKYTTENEQEEGLKWIIPSYTYNIRMGRNYRVPLSTPTTCGPQNTRKIKKPRSLNRGLELQTVRYLLFGGICCSWWYSEAIHSSVLRNNVVLKIKSKPLQATLNSALSAISPALWGTILMMTFQILVKDSAGGQSCSHFSSNRPWGQIPETAPLNPSETLS